MYIVDKFNYFFHLLMEKRVQFAYNKKVANVFSKSPEYNNPVDAETTRRHLELFKKLRIKYDDRWLRLYSNISGIVDYRYIPESIYASVVERILNDCECCNHEYEDKNMLYKLIDNRYLPHVYIRYVRGIYYDHDFNYLPRQKVDEMLKIDRGSMIGKIAIESSGGKGVTAFNFIDGKYISKKGVVLSTNYIENTFSHYLVQEKIEQCDFSKQFNSASVNTCRIMTLRCPWNGNVVILKSFFRMGIGDSPIDNMSSGGICVSIDSNGMFNDNAYDYKALQPLSQHPTSNIVFKGLKNPYYKAMCDVVVSQAKIIPQNNIISWDVVVDNKDQVKIIETNLVSQNPDIAQINFGPLFGEYTEDLIDWIVEHKKYRLFNHLRTF